ncbi:hypothetical protein [Streptomyces coeruleorubidus]|uniref:Uncharacterized protein n=1 Tax=Streptomyces coeruleorubidus TaxID=116188 RepID=A0A5J6HVX3_STRC4|nr:hypothetical protein [Streptomyces coeruleorubidus]QEV23988.1 hypothetical protein CP976_07395 [Streptomyces coeruleorubidus]GGT85566.1 hypothetical protein GCM10010256_52090 [Streptomyces coeruleorubidus]
MTQPDFTSPIAGRVEVRDPCPWCPDRPMVPRSLMDGHVARVHPEVQTVEPPADRAAMAEALLLHFTAEAHRRKWAYGRGVDDDGVPIKSEAFDALHRLGEEMRVELEKLRRLADEAQPGTEAEAPSSKGAPERSEEDDCDDCGRALCRDCDTHYCIGPCQCGTGAHTCTCACAEYQDGLAAAAEAQPGTEATSAPAAKPCPPGCVACATDESHDPQPNAEPQQDGAQS